MESFTCPECRATSYYPEDVRYGYCGRCHKFTGSAWPDQPYEPPGLRDLIGILTYKPGWQTYMGLFEEDGEARCWAFYVISDTEDSLNPGRRIRVRHEFLIPPASYNRDVWAAWLLDRLGDVEMHERNEFFRLDGVREFAPHHGNGEDPYRTWHVSDYATAAKRSGDD